MSHRSIPHRSSSADWPDLSSPALLDTVTHLHLLTQMVGKIRLVQTPWINHSWHVPLYVTARGLSSSLVPFGARAVDFHFDFMASQLRIDVADGATRAIPLGAGSVASFYRALLEALDQLGLEASIHTTPSEIEGAIPFEDDDDERPYDDRIARDVWRALLQIERVFQEFRSDFIGKNSPIHFFWGSFDLAVTRFSGREAPPHPGGVPNFPDWVAREAYSHEVSSAGFWPGGANVEAADFQGPIVYAYAYPQPEGFERAAVRPDASAWSDELGEFVLPYEAIRTAPSPDEALLAFLRDTYDAAADLADWDREALERRLPHDALSDSH